MPEGKIFGDLWEWQQIYLQRPKLLIRSFVKHFLADATGADYGVRSIIQYTREGNPWRGGRVGCCGER